jgi:hypothetical protein
MVTYFLGLLTLPARFSKGIQFEVMVRAPLIRPDDPRPAIALATINILEEFARAHKRDPSSKMPRNIKKDH